MANVLISIVFRALNEEKFFRQALQACQRQKLNPGLAMELLLVDSGSTDGTLKIAEEFNCRIIHIPKTQFTFGRSLNWGCEAARGKILVFISAHCIPVGEQWLQNLVQPLLDGHVQYSYGKQIGGEESKYSEKQLFAKYFPDEDSIPQDGFFVNNANAAILTDTWKKYKFDEEVTGLEDMVLGKALLQDNGLIGYTANAPVIHIHEETLTQVKRRYYRESLTLREVMPEVHMNFFDFLRYLFAGIANDLQSALEEKALSKEIAGIFSFRLMQFWGSYKGHNENRKLSREQKERYYYPAVSKPKAKLNSHRDSIPSNK